MIQDPVDRFQRALRITLRALAIFATRPHLPGLGVVRARAGELADDLSKAAARLDGSQPSDAKRRAAAHLIAELDVMNRRLDAVARSAQPSLAD